MQLYSKTFDPYSHRVRIVLMEKEIEFKQLIIDKSSRAEEELIQINPYGATPTLVDRELILYPSELIMEYLEERFLYPSLLPIYPTVRARYRLMMYRLNRDWYSLLEKITAGGETEEVREARKHLSDSITSIAPIFAERLFIAGENFSLVDCCIAPLLWRLPWLKVELPPQADSVLSYAERLFKRQSFIMSLTEEEQAMRT